ncbi:MAG: aminotransferase class III-fold pyridoxal phosphate-dependent enzyme [Tannerellaceae bacterium]|nr:aminotransferase class III-fold pyridoxal phosphate-dependent enzyme [Tannerellaceae bacterium]
MKLFDVYSKFDINITRGLGCHVWDAYGKEYLDLYGGHAVISIGHSHPAYIKALTEQLARLGFYSNAVQNPLQEHLAEKLGEASGYADYSLFLINTGAEANENAIKIAALHNRRTRIISFAKSFHGRTAAAARVTDNPNFIIAPNANMQVIFLPLNRPEQVEQEMRKGDISSIIIEGIQGVGGIHIPTDEFLRDLRSLCTKYDVCMIVDEIQSGYGRSGKFFAHQYSGIRPDLITVAKGMGNGFPIGGVLISPMFKPENGSLGSTFGGNHLACAAAISVLDVMKSENLVANAANVGQRIINSLHDLPNIKEIRGKGLMIGLEMETPVKDFRRILLHSENVFTGVAGSNIVRLLPPLSLSEAEADDALQRLAQAASAASAS